MQNNGTFRHRDVGFSVSVWLRQWIDQYTLRHYKTSPADSCCCNCKYDVWIQYSKSLWTFSWPRADKCSFINNLHELIKKRKQEQALTFKQIVIFVFLGWHSSSSGSDQLSFGQKFNTIQLLLCAEDEVVTLQVVEDLQVVETVWQ